MSILQVYSKRVVALLVMFAVANYVLHECREYVGAWGYIIGLPTLVAVFCILIARQVWKEIPPGAGAMSEKSMVVNAASERVCEAVPGVVVKNRWKLLDADKREGHFKVKIGLNFYTYSEIMLIDVSRIDEGSAKVSVRCEALHQTYDWGGKNDKDIAKFYRRLENSLEGSKV